MATPFIDAWERPDGLIQVAIWDDIDTQDEPAERRVMTVDQFEAEFPNEPIQGGLFTNDPR